MANESQMAERGDAAQASMGQAFLGQCRRCKEAHGNRSSTQEPTRYALNPVDLSGFLEPPRQPSSAPLHFPGLQIPVTCPTISGRSFPALWLFFRHGAVANFFSAVEREQDDMSGWRKHSNKSLVRHGTIAKIMTAGSVLFLCSERALERSQGFDFQPKLGGLR